MKKYRRILLLCLISVITLAACGPADIGFSNLIINNDNDEAIKKIEIDAIEVTDSTGSSISLDSGGRIELYLEFITEEQHEIKATYADDETEIITEKLSVNTNSTNTITFGEEPPETAEVVLKNETGEVVMAIYFCDELTSTPGENFRFIRAPYLFSGGLGSGSSYTMDIAGEGDYYIYTEDLDGEYTLQGSLSLVYNNSVSFTASN